MDVSEAFRRAADDFERVVASLDDAAWDRPTACDVAVRELIWHVIAGNYFAVRLLGGASTEDAVNGLDQIGPGGQLLRELSDSCAAQTEAFARGDRGGALHHPSGDIDYETFVRYRLGDLVIHAWDVASAAAVDVNLDPEVVDELWRRVAPHLEEMRAAGGYGRGASGLLADDAPALELLLDAFGRRP